jgi:hypothetical protein
MTTAEDGTRTDNNIGNITTPLTLTGHFLPSVATLPPLARRAPAKATSKRASPYLEKSSSAPSSTLLEASRVASRPSVSSKASDMTSTTASAKDCEGKGDKGDGLSESSRVESAVCWVGGKSCSARAHLGIMRDDDVSLPSLEAHATAEGERKQLEISKQDVMKGKKQPRRDGGFAENEVGAHAS